MSKRHSVDSLIVPAIATGTGKLSKAAFYNKLLVDTLVPQLNQKFYIPPNVYLHVWSGDSDKRWPETQKAIASALTTAVDTWNFRSEHKDPNSEWLTVVGVALGCSLISLAFLLGVHIRFVSDALPLFTTHKPLVILSWIAAAVGLVSVFKVILEFSPTGLNPYAQMAAGFLAAFLSGPITRAQDTVNSALRRDPSIAPDSSLIQRKG
jgi:hypothetical protein